MTNKIIETARERIASYLWQCRDIPPTHDLEALRRAKQILSLSFEVDGEWYDIVVARRDAKLPNVPKEIRLGWDIHRRYYKQGQQDMLQQGWRKTYHHGRQEDDQGS